MENRSVSNLVDKLLNEALNNYQKEQQDRGKMGGRPAKEKANEK